VVQLAAGGVGSDEWLLSACPGSVLKLWHLQAARGSLPPSSPELRARLAGPADRSTGLDVCCSSSGTLALSVDGTQQVDVFLCEAASNSGAGKQATLSVAFVLSSHEQISSARFVRSKADEGRATVIGFGASLAAIWSFRPEKASRKGVPRTVAPSFVVLSSELGGRVLSARTLSQPQRVPASLVVAFGPVANPAFAAAHAPVDEAGTVSIEHLAGGARQAQVPRELGSAAAAADKATPAALSTKATVARTAASFSQRHHQQQPQQPTVLGPLEAAVARRQPRRRPLAEVAEEPEEDMEDGARAVPSRKRLKLLPEGSRAPSGLSIAPMVRQGLRCKDSASIHEALERADRRVIDSTVAELTGAEAFDLLQECTHRLLSQPVRGQVLCSWIQRVLMRHCAFIFSQPVLHRALQPLHDAFQARCTSHRTLVRLRGRLQALRNCGRLALASSKRATSAADASASAPLLEYVEGDENIVAEEEAGEDTSPGCEGGSGEDDDDDDDFDEEDSDDDILIDGSD